MPRLITLLLLMLLASTGCAEIMTRDSLYATVKAEVTRRDGRPIPGAQLVLYTGQRPMGYGATDSAGRYTFLDVPEGVYGVLAVPPPGYARLETLLATERPSEVRDQLLVRAGDRLPARFTFFKEGPGTVRAEVREPSGTPVPGILTVLYAPGGEVRRATTNAEGRVVFDNVPFGMYGVTVERPVQFRDSGEVALPFRDGLVVEEGADTLATFTFARCEGTLTAQVTDQDARAVPGARVVLYTGQGVLARDPLDLTGSRTFGPLGCADYGVRAEVPRGYVAAEEPGRAYRDGLRVRRGGTPRTTLVVQRLARGTLRVRAVDQDSRAVVDARTILYTARSTVRDVRTGPDGTVTMDTILMEEPHGVRVVPPRGYALAEGRGVSYVDDVRLADGELRELTFRMQRLARATVTAQVVDEADRPVRDALVELYTSTSSEQTARTGADGSVTFSDVIADSEYGVLVVPPVGYTVVNTRGERYVDGVRLVDGEVRRVVLRVRRAP